MTGKKAEKPTSQLDQLVNHYAGSKDPAEIFHRNVMKEVSKVVELWRKRIIAISKLDEDKQAEAFGVAGYTAAKSAMLLLGLTIGATEDEVRANNLRLAISVVIGALEDLAKADLIPSRNEVISGRTVVKASAVQQGTMH